MCAKITRFLVPLKPDHGKIIEGKLQEFWGEIIDNPHPTVQNLTAASCLLEQSEIIRGTAEQNMPGVLTWILQQLTDVQHSIASSEIGIENFLTISSIVKFVLQLFQSCSPTTCAVAWNDGTEDNPNHQIVKQILLRLFQILDNETLSADVKMLSGTAIGIFFASAPTNHLSIRKFWTAFSNIFQGSRSHVSSFDEVMAEGEIEEHSLLQQRLGAIAMVKGMLACSSDECLAFHSKEYVPFCVELFTVVHEYCMGPISIRYHAFNLLQIWFSKFLHLISSDAIQCKDFIQSYLMRTTLDIVRLNWDSPVDDVSELATGSLKYLFEVWEMAHKEKDRKSSKDPDSFYSSILLKLKSVPWYIKGQYKVMSALVPYVGSHYIIREYPALAEELLKCLTSNYLASASADVYKALVADLRTRTEETEFIRSWEAMWWTTLIAGLLSDQTLQRNNINQYWIPSTTKISPDLGCYIQSKLGQLLTKEKCTTGDRSRLLFAYLCVSKVIRATKVCALQNVELIREGLYSYQDEIRSEALGLVCVSHKKAEPLSKTEDTLLREVLSQNLKIDSAPFRQHLVAHLKRLLMRVRDGAIALIKSGDSNLLDVSLQFVEWLHTLCIDNLVPGACYQRRKICLEILSILYETFQYNEKAKQRKSFTPESTKRLNQHVKEKGLWDFFCSHSNTVLITCILDGADDIQELACSLLLEYFTWPLDGSPGPSGDGFDGSTECHLLTKALQLSNSPKPYQCQSGALLCKLVFSKCVLENGWQFSIRSDHCTCDLTLTEKTGRQIDSFLCDLLKEVREMLVQSQDAPVKASKTVSIHGYVTAITRCLTECPQLLQHDSIANFKEHYLSLVQLNTQIIQTMLGIMARGSESEGCPSFAEIGQALESLILENEEDYSQTEALSGEHQYLLSWCWVNIKESCLSLGHLSRVMISFSDEMDTKVEVVQSIGDTFIRVLTQCRHRSMESLKVKASSTSTTRKSAGLPVIIQSIVSCERRTKKSELMRTALEGLFNMAELPLDKSIDDRHDLPQVHALNILKCLYGDSGLHEALMQFIGKAVILVVEQFGSPAWSIRNAATRLFSVLMTRLFGQKKMIGSQACNTKSLSELSAHYPELVPFLLQSLENALQREITAIDSLHPSLFPVLTILSNMGRLDQESESSEALPLRSFVKTLLRSPVYYLRQLSAAAYVSLVPQKVTMNTAKELLSELKQSNESNFIHGALVSVELLINSCNEIPEEVTNTLLNIQSSVAGLPDLVSAQYVHLLCCLIDKTNQTTKSKILSTVKQFCSDAHRKEQKMPKPLTEKASVDCLIQYEHYSVCVEMLLSGEVDADVKLYVIEAITALIREDKISETLPQLLKCTQTENYPPLKSALLSCMTALYMKQRTMNKSDLGLLKEIWQQNKHRILDRGVLGVGVLELGSVYLDACILNEQTREVDDQDVLLICDAMYQISSSVDRCKQAVCHCLAIFGQAVLRLCQQRKGELFLSSVIKLFFCVWNLVQDEDTDVRVHAANFIASLSQEFNQEWISYFSGHFWWSSEVVREAFLKLYHPGSVLQLSMKPQKGKQLYEAEDNSFYSEAIFNAGYLFQMLQKLLALGNTNEVTHSYMQGINVQDIVQDLQFVEAYLNQLDEKPACLSEENISQMNAGYNNIMTARLDESALNPLCYDARCLNKISWFHYIHAPSIVAKWAEGRLIQSCLEKNPNSKILFK
uniref:Thyroid adenoma-associated protein n=1 Tax=Magallana gigas TaxID=29159 RepID=K1PGZ0_MAGGI